MPPIYINGQQVTKRYVGIAEVVKAYVGSQQVFSGSTPSTGIFFDSSAGDSFSDKFINPGDASLIISAGSAAFSSATTKTVDFNLKDDAGNVMWQALDYFEVDATYQLTSFPASGVQGFYTGWVSSVTGEYGAQVKAHAVGAAYAFAHGVVSGYNAVDDTLGPTIGAGIQVRVLVRQEGGVLVARLFYPVEGQRTLDATMNYTPGVTELPRGLSKIGSRFKTGVVELQSMKISAGFPNAKFAFIGDSITQGRVTTNYSDGYARQVRSVFPNDVLCAGAPSTTIGDWVGKTYQIRALKPKNIFIMLGANNFVDGATSLSTAQADYLQLVSELSATGAKIIPISVTPCGYSDVATFNAWLSSNYPHYIDVYSLLLGSGYALNAAYDSGDNIHLNTAGNTVIANKILAEITAQGLG